MTIFSRHAAADDGESLDAAEDPPRRRRMRRNPTDSQLTANGEPTESQRTTEGVCSTQKPRTSQGGLACRGPRRQATGRQGSDATDRDLQLNPIHALIPAAAARNPRLHGSSAIQKHGLSSCFGSSPFQNACVTISEFCLSAAGNKIKLGQLRSVSAVRHLYVVDSLTSEPSSRASERASNKRLKTTIPKIANSTRHIVHPTPSNT